MTPTQPDAGPQVVTFLVHSNSDGCVFCCTEDCRHLPTPTPAIDGAGRRIFSTKTGQFVIVVEGIPGVSRASAGTSLLPGSPDNRPDLQIQATAPQGDGDPLVPSACPPGPTSSDDGVPAIVPPSFATNDPTISAKLNDFACRFDPFVGVSAPCTILDATRDSKLVNPAATVQFCAFLAADEPFPAGELVLSAKLRDIFGNTGPTAQIVVRVATPTPGPP